mmetsp:Transcript_48436/g.149758  ORF Transcript_48436/g.149758 Transcript_48436/m.149758 type:complete len:387 (-) Transcript_48436:49-1209(-)
MLSRIAVTTTTTSQAFQNLSRARKNCFSAAARNTKLTAKKMQKRSARRLRPTSPDLAPGSSKPATAKSSARRSVSRTTMRALAMMAMASTNSYQGLLVNLSSSVWLANTRAAFLLASGVTLRVGLRHRWPVRPFSHRLCCGVFSALPKPVPNRDGSCTGIRHSELLAPEPACVRLLLCWLPPARLLLARLTQLLDADLRSGSCLGAPSGCPGRLPLQARRVEPQLRRLGGLVQPLPPCGESSQRSRQESRSMLTPLAEANVSWGSVSSGSWPELPGSVCQAGQCTLGSSAVPMPTPRPRRASRPEPGPAAAIWASWSWDRSNTRVASETGDACRQLVVGSECACRASHWSKHCRMSSWCLCNRASTSARSARGWAPMKAASPGARP